MAALENPAKRSALRLSGETLFIQRRAGNRLDRLGRIRLTSTFWGRGELCALALSPTRPKGQQFGGRLIAAQNDA